MPPPHRVPPLTDGIRVPSTSTQLLAYGTHFHVVDAPIGSMTSARNTSGTGVPNVRSSDSAKRLIRTSLYS